MISKINKIKDYGVFKNFNGASISEFKTFNLIYGWNYSGKTTLSRVFRCLEKKSNHVDYIDATFELEHEKAKYDNAFILTPNIRVFNADFIKDNLKWDDDNIEPIFLLGEENIELQRELSERKENCNDLVISNASLIKSRNEKKERISNALTSKARSVGTLLSIRPFDSRHFSPLVELVITKPNLLEQKEFDSLKVQALSNEQKPIIELNKLLPKDLLDLENEVAEILNRQATSDNKIQKLLNDKLISDWVETGKEIHSNSENCEFCGNILPKDLIVKLNAHFSKDFEKLKADTSQQIEYLNKNKLNTSINLSITAFYKDLHDKFTITITELNLQKKKYNQFIETLIADLEAKKDKPFDIRKLTKSINCFSELTATIKIFEDLITENNKRTDEFNEQKAIAIDRLKLHYATEFENAEKYSVVQQELINDNNEIEKINARIDKEEKEILQLQSKLNETTKGASKVNSYLKMFFGKDDIEIASTDDSKFKLVRQGNIAKNLSEGEKTAISFAYFTAKLEEKDNKISETIVYIDDPISSLDSNHLFNIYSFIKNTFYELIKVDGKNIHSPKCKQLFISTHNFEFYNLIYDWISSCKKEQYNCFLIERTKNALSDESSIKNSNQMIEKYKSEYVYLYSIIKKFHDNPNDAFEQLYHLPNILRKFMETYLNFKYLASKNIEENIADLIINPIECERARKFMHYYSHSLTTDKFLKLSDLSECKDVVSIIMNAISTNDNVHYTSLNETIAKMTA